MEVWFWLHFFGEIHFGCMDCFQRCDVLLAVHFQFNLPQQLTRPHIQGKADPIESLHRGPALAALNRAQMRAAYIGKAAQKLLRHAFAFPLSLYHSPDGFCVEHFFTSWFVLPKLYGEGEEVLNTYVVI